MKEYLEKFVTEYQFEPNRFSCLIDAIQTARFLAGRNLLTGATEGRWPTNGDGFISNTHFIVLINYLLVLDLIGTIFCKGKEGNIANALANFSSLSKKERLVVAALRNSLAHNFGLVNIPRDPKNNQNSRHKFNIIHSDNAPLIEFPSSQWDGDWENNGDETSTKISSKKLIDVVEFSYQDLVQKVKLGSAACGISLKEFNLRFTWSIGL